METRPRSGGRLLSYFAFAVAVSVVCQVALGLTTLAFFQIRPDQPFSLKLAVVNLTVGVLSYASGGFVLGTLTRGLMGPWPAAIIYITPSVLLRLGLFSLAFVSDAVRNDLVSQPGNLIGLPLLTLALAPFVAFFSVRAGGEAAGEYNQRNSVLNIPWYHWLWVLPLYLFPVVGVPSFLLLTLWSIDLLEDHIRSSLVNLPSFISRIIVLIVLFGVLRSIGSAYSTLSERG